ncbi:MAG TPA: hypothetical protein VG602_02265 [Actinomycetota bacterium]|nr:hypothetical protein [Actinomycetota bacterium]
MGVIVAGATVVIGAVVAFVLLGDDGPPSRAVVPAAVSPVPGEQDATPGPGESPSTLRELLPQSVGEFQLVTADSAPQFAENLDATDAVESQYLRPDGKEILHNVALYRDRARAAAGQDKLLGGFEEIGYQVVETNRSQGIEVTRLSGPKEALVWTHGPILATVEGPPDVTTQFYLDLPY